MKLEDVEALLSTVYSIVDRQRLPNDKGTPLTLQSGQKVNVFDTGRGTSRARTRPASTPFSSPRSVLAVLEAEKFSSCTVMTRIASHSSMRCSGAGSLNR